jgi:hypothetical protein
MGDPEQNGPDQADDQAQKHQPIASGRSASESGAQVGGLVTGKTSGVAVAGAWEGHKGILAYERNDRPPARGRQKTGAFIARPGLAMVGGMQQDADNAARAAPRPRSCCVRHFLVMVVPRCAPQSAEVWLCNPATRPRDRARGVTRAGCFVEGAQKFAPKLSEVPGA